MHITKIMKRSPGKNEQSLLKEGMPEAIRNTITEMSDTEAQEAERDNYAPEMPDHVNSNDPIVTYSGLCDVDSEAISMETVQN